MPDTPEKDAPRYGIVVVPDDAALVQDLGPFRSGRLMEADILPQSALVCAEDDRPGAMRAEEDGSVRFFFEGNANGADNLKTFHDRCIMAAGRLATGAATIARGRARPEELKVVARIDLLSYTFVEMLDTEAFEAWGGEALSSFLPPPHLKTPCSDAAALEPLMHLPMRIRAHGERGIYVWQLLDGTILTHADNTLTAWRAGDPGLSDILDTAGISVAARLGLGLPM